MSEDQGGELADSVTANKRRPVAQERLQEMIRNSLRRAFLESVEAGKRLAYAHDEHKLEGKAWRDFLTGIPISESQASKLMKIARFEPYAKIVSHAKDDPATVNSLPKDAETLYLLAGLGAEIFTRALESGQIRPAMSRDEVGILRPPTGRPREQKQAETKDGHAEQGDDAAGATAEHHHEWVCRKCQVPMPDGAKPFSVANGEVLERHDGNEGAE